VVLMACALFGALLWHRTLRRRARMLVTIESTGIPEEYLASPTSALAQWGKAAWEGWLAHTEPRLRTSRGYPADWEWRRLYVLERDNRKCIECGAGGTREQDLHVHHVIPLSIGGNNDLGNLVALCLFCHDKKHPGGTLKSSYLDRRNSSLIRLWRKSGGLLPGRRYPRGGNRRFRGHQ
jgi:hypothetical protein